MKPKIFNTTYPALALFVACLMSIGSPAVLAQDVGGGGGSLGESGSRSGTSGATELLVPLTARYTSLGATPTAGLADMNGLEGLYANPAALSVNQGTAVLFSRLEYVADIGVNYLGLAQSIGNNNLAFTISAWDFGDIPEQTESAPEITDVTFSVNYFTAGLSYSRQLTDRIAAGATMKLINESIDDLSASAVAFDAGMTYVLPETGLRLGISLKNIGYELAFGGTGLVQLVRLPGQDPTANQNAVSIESDGVQLPTQLNFGAAYTRPIAGSNYVTVLGNFRSNSFDEDQYSAGIEVGFQNLLYGRAGYQFSNEMEDLTFYEGYAFGGGLKIPLGGQSRIMVDYAFQPVKFFDNVQFITAAVEL